MITADRNHRVPAFDCTLRIAMPGCFIMRDSVDDSADCHDQSIHLLDPNAAKRQASANRDGLIDLRNRN
jgi:hypothetical protein